MVSYKFNFSTSSSLHIPVITLYLSTMFFLTPDFILHFSWPRIQSASFHYFSNLLHLCPLFFLLNLISFLLLTLPHKTSWLCAIVKHSFLTYVPGTRTIFFLDPLSPHSFKTFICHLYPYFFLCHMTSLYSYSSFCHLYYNYLYFYFSKIVSTSEVLIASIITFAFII